MALETRKAYWRPLTAPTATPSGSGPLFFVADAEAGVKAGARLELTDARTEAAAQDDAALAAREATAQSDLRAPTPVAVVDPPWAKDSAGQSVPTSLSVDGDTLRMTVDHQGQGFSYPIAADPWVEVVRERMVWKREAVNRTETYVHHYNIRFVQVGSWHHSWCSQSANACRHEGNGWYTVWTPGGWRFLSYNPNLGWGPLFLGISEPVYAQRTVFDHWRHFQVRETYTDRVWVDGLMVRPMHYAHCAVSWVSAVASASQLTTWFLPPTERGTPVQRRRSCTPAISMATRGSTAYGSEAICCTWDREATTG